MMIRLFIREFYDEYRTGCLQNAENKENPLTWVS